MFLLLFLVTVISGLILLYIWYTEPRRLLLGAAFIAFILSLGLSLVYVLMVNELTVLVVFFLVIFILSQLLAPFILVGSFLYSGVTLIKKEGFRFTNLLSLLFGVGLVLYMTIWPMISDLTEQTVYNYIYSYISLIIIYVIMLINLYTMTLVLNLIHFSKPNVDYLVVLGAGLDGEKVTPLLASRVDKAVSLYRDNPNIKLIMTGGQGDDELVSEARAMAEYAMSLGVPKKAIILEDKAVNTEENILFSYALMSGKEAKFAVVTNAYHVFRALLIAKEKNMKCIGYGSRTKWYFTLNAFIREFVGYLYFKRQLHLVVLSSFTLLYALFYAVISYLMTKVG